MVNLKSFDSFLLGNAQAHDKKETQVVQKDKIKFVFKKSKQESFILSISSSLVFIFPHRKYAPFLNV